MENNLGLINATWQHGNNPNSSELKQNIHALSSKANGSLDEKRAALREASRQFEAVFMNQMISAMRKTVGAGGILNKSNGESIFEGMLDEEWAKKMASKTGPNSLSEILYKQLSYRMGLEEKTEASIQTNKRFNASLNNSTATISKGKLNRE
ncbi:MAG: rod-binding protein [Candidatus Latescibacterota bacterium]|nr:rod-binding protein [Candidatus Latescibacterota bacterium]